jgi:hypothetical protein
MNRSLRHFLVVLVLALVPSFVFGDDYSGEGMSVEAPGAMGEAAKAVVDRVFGVEGEAANIDYHAIELSNRSPFNAGIRSALLPGLGQRFNRQPVKGAILFTAVAVGLFGTLRTYDKSDDSYEEYEATGNSDDPAYDDYSRFRTQSMVLGGATLAIWIYSVVDAYRNAYNPLVTEDTGVQLALNETGAAVEWRRRF